MGLCASSDKVKYIYPSSVSYDTHETTTLFIFNNPDYLKFPDGKKWILSYMGHEWLSSPHGFSWFISDDGNKWRYTSRGISWITGSLTFHKFFEKNGLFSKWLDTTDGKGWIYSKYAILWLVTYKAVYFFEKKYNLIKKYKNDEHEYKKLTENFIVNNDPELYEIFTQGLINYIKDETIIYTKKNILDDETIIYTNKNILDEE
jgi:hypothetical protein